jgi:hypothetical protein
MNIPLRLWLTFVCVPALFVQSGLGSALADPLAAPGICDQAAASAEQEAGLPARLLGAIAEVESGRRDPATGTVHPWPWTINAEGEGKVFASKAAAVAAVHALQDLGVRSIDVGCMQINLLHHPTAFGSLDDAFDPSANARYAARFLNALHGKDSSWLPAVAAYHSLTPQLGADYRARVLAVWQVPESARAGAIQVLHAVPRLPYRDFAAQSHVYADFRPWVNVYAAFAAAPPSPARNAKGTILPGDDTYPGGPRTASNADAAIKTIRRSRPGRPGPA